MMRKVLCGAMAATMLVAAAAPAEARERRGRWHHRDDGIGTDEVVGGLLVVGAVAAIASAFTKNKDTGYEAEQRAVDACVREAEGGGSRYNPARVTDIDNVDRREGYYYVTGYMNVAGDGPDPQEVGFSCTTRSGRIYDFSRGGGYHW
jgi:hypothetical protein